jgi:membrane protein
MATTGLENIKLSDKLYTIPDKKGFKRSYILFVRVFLVSLYRFLADDCLTRASAIAYTNIVSLVPVLTVALAFITITSGVDQKQDQFFDSINTFLLKNEIKIDLTPYIETLKDIISSASQIGAVGFIVLIFSATAILRTFEAAFNQIWRISVPRSFTYKIIFYFFIISIGPLITAVFLGFASKLADAVRSSHLYSITRSTDNFIWISGENGTIVKIDEKGKRIAKLKDFKIDFENLYCVDLATATDITCEAPRLPKEDFIKFRNRKNQLVTLSQNGVLLQSFDLGINWTVTSFVNTKCTDFTIADENNIFILLATGEIINYHGKNRFTKVIVNYKNSDSKVIGTRIRFPDPLNGYFLDTNGYFWKTTNGGKDFTPYNITKGSLNLTDMAIIDNTHYVVVGEKGSIYKSDDSAKTWSDLSHKKISYTKIWNMNNEGREELIILNEIGSILYSYDLGLKWNVTYSKEAGKLNAMLPINPKFGFAALNPDDDDIPKDGLTNQNKVALGDVLAVGDFGNISIGDFKDNEIVWKKISGGDNVFSLFSLINTLIPLIAIWIFFIMLYMLIPNTKVPFKAAAIGSAMTGIILLIFIYAFGIYIKSFSTSTVIIYRALAAVPLFLLVVYCLSIIILFGAEITATLHYSDRYKNNRNPWDEDEELRFSFYNSIRFMQQVYAYQKKSRGFIPAVQLKDEMKITSIEFDFLTEKLIKEKFISKVEDQTFAPCIRPDDLSLFDLFQKISNESFSAPEFATEPSFLLTLNEKIKQIDDFSKQSLQKINFGDLLT